MSLPGVFFEQISINSTTSPSSSICCAGFENKKWRSKGMARHLIEWLPDYALTEEEQQVHPGNIYAKLEAAAVRVYTSKSYEQRGEAGEICLHAICRHYFGTFSISPRVFYLSASNDVVKSFDIVHARIEGDNVQLWLGESKLYTKRSKAISDAVNSVKAHLDSGFIKNQKILLGPQIPKNTPKRDKILELFDPNLSTDKFLAAAVFVVCIACEADCAQSHETICDKYKIECEKDMSSLVDYIKNAGFDANIRILLIYVPLGSKKEMLDEFDRKLKGLQ